MSRAAACVPRALRRDPGQGVHPDAPRPADLRDDVRHPDPAAHAVRLRDQLRPEAPADRGADRRPRPVRAQPRARAREQRLFPRSCAQTASEAEADWLLATGEVQFVLHIPTDFGRDAAARRAPGGAGRGRRDRPGGDRQRAVARSRRSTVARSTTTSTGPLADARRARRRRSSCASSAATTPRASRTTTSCRA